MKHEDAILRERLQQEQAEGKKRQQLINQFLNFQWEMKDLLLANVRNEHKDKKESLEHFKKLVDNVPHLINQGQYTSIDEIKSDLINSLMQVREAAGAFQKEKYKSAPTFFQKTIAKVINSKIQTEADNILKEHFQDVKPSKVNKLEGFLAVPEDDKRTYFRKNR